MTTRFALLASIVLVMSVAPALAEKPLKDYSFVRGVNYSMDGDQAVIERDLGYAKRINLNSTRIWLGYQFYEKDPKAFIARLKSFIETSHRMGFTTMPILWGGNDIDPKTLKPEFRPRGDAYVKAVVEALKDEPGLLMWDVMNELVTNAQRHAFPEGFKGRVDIRIDAAQGLRLSVADNGQGMSEDIRLEGAKTLGFMLVSALARQLGGEVALERNPGTKWTIRFSPRS